jgi:putative restriction endonuclease
VGPKRGVKSWAHDELMVVCNLYFTLPFGQMHSRNPLVVALAHSLGRTPGSVAMKLVNFASLDPMQQARGVVGLRGVSQADRAVWDEFRERWATAAIESENNLQNRLSARPGWGEEEKLTLRLIAARGRPTEVAATVQVRIVQSFFRRAVLSAYKSRCCVTGNPVPQLLVASHILPWSDFPNERLNPKNGLCLVAHFDKAFDEGLITFGPDLKLKISPTLLSYLPNEALEREFVSREGALLHLPERFAPDEAFLDYHRNSKFQKSRVGS